MPFIKLQSSDGQVFDVDVKVAQQSMTIKTMLDELGFSEEDEKTPIPLPNVSNFILQKVIEFCTYHQNDDPYTEDDNNSERRSDDLSAWDTEFVKVDNDVLFDLILAANYLDIKRMLDVTCKTIANMIKGKTPDEIRKIFRIEKNEEPVAGPSNATTA